MMLSPLLAVTELPAGLHIATGHLLGPMRLAEKTLKIAQTAEIAALILKQTIPFNPTAISLPVPRREVRLKHHFFKAA